MTDILIRDLPETVVAAIDSRTSQLGLSPNEYLRRRLSQDAARSAAPVGVADLQGFSGLFSDLTDPDAMAQGWS